MYNILSKDAAAAEKALGEAEMRLEEMKEKRRSRKGFTNLAEAAAESMKEEPAAEEKDSERKGEAESAEKTANPQISDQLPDSPKQKSPAKSAGESAGRKSIGKNLTGAKLVGKKTAFAGRQRELFPEEAEKAASPLQSKSYSARAKGRRAQTGKKSEAPPAAKSKKKRG